MDYCGPRGIPLSEFLSWDDDDQDAALLWQAHESRRCSGCGTHPEEWDPATGGRRDAYKPELRMCPGCMQLEQRRAQLADGPAMHGAHLVLRPTSPPASSPSSEEV